MLFPWFFRCFHVAGMLFWLSYYRFFFSVSVILCWSTILPRYMKLSTSSISLLSIFNIAFVVIALKNFELAMFMLSPICADVSFTVFIFSCIWAWVCERSAKSSAKSKSSNCDHGVHCIPFLLLLLANLPIYCRQEQKSGTIDIPDGLQVLIQMIPLVALLFLFHTLPTIFHSFPFTYFLQSLVFFQSD